MFLPAFWGDLELVDMPLARIFPSLKHSSRVRGRFRQERKIGNLKFNQVLGLLL